MIYDINQRMRALKGTTATERLAEASATFPDVGIVALNGVPFFGDPPTYFGVDATPETIRMQFRSALGFGGLFAFMNTGNRSLVELAATSLKRGHDWHMHTIGVTLCFAGCPTFIEMSFARDARFHLLWVEPRSKTDWNLPRLFTASASLKHWKKYLANRDAEEFLRAQRDWLARAHAVLEPLFPEYLR